MLPMTLEPNLVLVKRVLQVTLQGKNYIPLLCPTRIFVASLQSLSYPLYIFLEHQGITQVVPFMFKNENILPISYTSNVSQRKERGQHLLKGQAIHTTGRYGSHYTWLLEVDYVFLLTGGFYQDQMGQLHCKRCSPGTYVSMHRHPGRSATDCWACPYGEHRHCFLSRSSPPHIIIIVIIIIIIVSSITVFAGVLFLHQLGANHAPGASVTQVNHSFQILSTFLRICADPSMPADLLNLCPSSSL